MIEVEFEKVGLAVETDVEMDVVTDVVEEAGVADVADVETAADAADVAKAADEMNVETDEVVGEEADEALGEVAGVAVDGTNAQDCPNLEAVLAEDNFLAEAPEEVH